MYLKKIFFFVTWWITKCCSTILSEIQLPFKMTVFEIEQKFSWIIRNLNILKSNGGNPPFRHINLMNTQFFCDAYYDSHQKLSSAGLWVWKWIYCNGSKPSEAIGTQIWEVKQAVKGSSFNHSTFQKTRDVHLICQMISKRVLWCLGLSECFELNQQCQFRTSWHTFIADKKFTVVLNSTDFGHSVGEVKLLVKDVNKAYADIDAFLNWYAWFFDHSKLKGKLTAYFEKFETSQQKAH